MIMGETYIKSTNSITGLQKHTILAGLWHSLPGTPPKFQFLKPHS